MSLTNNHSLTSILSQLHNSSALAAEFKENIVSASFFLTSFGSSIKCVHSKEGNGGPAQSILAHMGGGGSVVSIHVPVFFAGLLHNRKKMSYSDS